MALSFSDTLQSNILRQLVLGEGERFVAYRCTAGKLTIGVGHNCDAKPVPGVTKVGDSITTGQSRQLFIEDITTAIKEVQKAFPWVVLLNEPRQAVLYDMAFNMGIGGLKTLKNTLKFIEGGHYEAAAMNIMRSKYAKDVRNDGLGGRYDRAERL